jgi:hypothetical protein
MLMLFLSLRRAPHDSEDQYADTEYGANIRVGHGEYEGRSTETRPRAIHSNPQNRTDNLLSFHTTWTGRQQGDLVTHS